MREHSFVPFKHSDQDHAAARFQPPSLSRRGGRRDKRTRRQMRAAWFLPLALLLVACGRSGEQEMEACHRDALRAYPAQSSLYSNSLDEFLKACMVAKGYTFSTLRYDCGHGDPYEDAACYL
jgi:hypothetical protein